MVSGLTQLRQFIVAHYSLEELRTLCFDLGVNYDDLGGEALSGKVRELILRLYRERALDRLLPLLATARPEAFAELGLDTSPATLDALYAENPAYSQPDRSLRDLELAYLDGLLKRKEYWRDHYTPLAGIAEVRAAVKDGPRLDLPMPFIPREFEVLAEHAARFPSVHASEEFRTETDSKRLRTCIDYRRFPSARSSLSGHLFAVAALHDFQLSLAITLHRCYLDMVK